MIDRHKIMIDNVASMPLVGGCQPYYDFGDLHNLNLIIKSHQSNQNLRLYPLIYDVSNRSTQSVRDLESNSRISLVIATRNPHTEYTNTNRWATSYKNVLFPVVGYLEQLFDRSPQTIWDGSYELYEFPNYGDTKETETIDIWDALRMDFDVTFTNDCFRQIKYSQL